jgi:hypothetical protein
VISKIHFISIHSFLFFIFIFNGGLIYIGLPYV